MVIFRGIVPTLVEYFPKTLNALTHLAYLDVAGKVMLEDTQLLEMLIKYGFENIKVLPLICILSGISSKGIEEKYVKYGILDLMYKYYDCEEWSVHIDILTIVFNLLQEGGEKIHKEFLRDRDLIPYVIDSLGKTRPRVRSAAIDVLKYFASHAKCGRDIQILVDEGIFKSIIELLETNKDSIEDKIEVLYLLKNIVATKKSEILSHNSHAVEFQNIGGLDVVEKLLDSPNHDLSKVWKNYISEFHGFDETPVAEFQWESKKQSNTELYKLGF
jgi:hypothetical protein